MRSLRVVFANSQAELKMPYKMNSPTDFQVNHYFDKVVFMSRELGEKKLNMNRNAVNRRLRGMTYRHFPKDVGCAHKALLV